MLTHKTQANCITENMPQPAPLRDSANRKWSPPTLAPQHIGTYQNVHTSQHIRWPYHIISYQSVHGTAYSTTHVHIYLPPHIEARRTMQWNTRDNISWPGLSEGSIEASTSGVVRNLCNIKHTTHTEIRRNNQMTYHEKGSGRGIAHTFLRLRRSLINIESQESFVYIKI